MDYSMTIAGYDIWKQWHMIPKERPVVVPPRLKTNYIDLTGIDGSLDYSEALNGRHYSNREGSWDFYVIIDKRVTQEVKFSTEKTWVEIYEDFLSKVHGQRVRLILTEDSGYFYQGRLEISSVQNENSWMNVTIDYVLEPNKYPVAASRIASTSDLWKSSSDTVFYKDDFTFTGDGVTKTLVNDSGSNQSLKVNAVSPIVITRVSDSSSVTVQPNHDPDGSILTVPTGSTEYSFASTYGSIAADIRVALDYTPRNGFIF